MYVNHGLGELNFIFLSSYLFFLTFKIDFYFKDLYEHIRKLKHGLGFLYSFSCF